MKHEKKVWPEYFQKIIDGKKTFEIRLADWECNENDILFLQEWDPNTKQFTGRTVEKIITFTAKTKNLTFWKKEDIDEHGYQIIAFNNMTNANQIEQEIDKIQERNIRVEADKAWETSAARKITVAIFTYFTIVLFFYFVKLPKPFINAIVPTIGFLLSTLSIPYFKNIWIKYYYK